VDAQRLAPLALFESLTPDERARVAGWAEELEVSAGRTLASEGAAGYFFYVIEEGTAEVVCAGELIAELGPGDFFGEGAILGEGRRVASVVSASRMRLIVMHGQQFRAMQAEMSDVAARIGETLKARLDRLPGAVAGTEVAGT
jgi:CRP-like cAMP-binding protein